ncbi:site-specific DNA-methyltransferase [Mesomycoplasma hyopneumoniae]|uniref:site-specific DNA-methyltransferase n=1 Tax=Mesomycoplasma hyopneumoniae TaxID=2099 RepID=UPI00385779BF
MLVIEREGEREGGAGFDIIYIDPPYNTEASKNDGNSIANEKEDIKASKFIYRDKFSRNGWLNLMNERLRLAKDLLKDDGIIFVSIDDAEQAYLKVLMDEIFGEENFVANLVWMNAWGSKQDAKYFSQNHEYILVYAKNIKKLKIKKINIAENSDQWKWNDKIQKWEKKLAILQKGSNEETIFDRKKMAYIIWWNEKLNLFKTDNNIDFNLITDDLTTDTIIYDYSTSERQLLISQGYVPIIPKTVRKNKYGRWTVSEQTFLEKVKNNEVKVQKIKDSYQIFRYDVQDKIPNSKEQNPRSVIFNSTLNKLLENKDNNKQIQRVSTSDGSSMLRSIFNFDSFFDFPKPVNLIKYIIDLFPSKNTRVLDFFAGSGTTGQAVLELNKEDGGNRSFVLVTNNENNIGQNVTYERLYRINKGQGTKGQKDFEWIKKNEAFDTNLNVFWSKTYNTSLLNNDITNQELKDKFLKLLKDFGINKDKEKFDDSVLKTLSSLRPYKEEN